MAKAKCEYCGKSYDDTHEEHLDNGSNCCPQCEEAENLHKQEKLEKEVPEE